MLIPGGAQTAAKAWLASHRALPRYGIHASGCRIQDSSGREYIDMIMGQGAVFLGYAEPSVTAAVLASVEALGGSTSLCHPLEGQLAEALRSRVPLLERTRFVVNGSDAVSAAVRLARRFTGRPVVLCCRDYGPQSDPHYHGWSDWVAAGRGAQAGLPAAARDSFDYFRFGDAEDLAQVLHRHSGQVAAAVMEGLKFDPPPPGYLSAVRDLTREAGVLLVFDEIVHGLRLCYGGAHQHYDVDPDLVCLGKAFANGFPVSVVGGRADAMELATDIGLSLTFAGAPFALAAMDVTLRESERMRTAETVRLRGAAFVAELRKLAQRLGVAERVRVRGYDARFILEHLDQDGRVSASLSAAFSQSCASVGVLCSDVHNVSLAHTPEDLRVVVEAYGQAWRKLPW